MLYSESLRKLPKVAATRNYAEAVSTLTVEEMRIEYAAIRQSAIKMGAKLQNFNDAVKGYISRVPHYYKRDPQPSDYIEGAHSFHCEYSVRLAYKNTPKGICAESGEPCTPRKPCYYCKGEAASARRMEAEYR